MVSIGRTAESERLRSVQAHALTPAELDVRFGAGQTGRGLRFKRDCAIVLRERSTRLLSLAAMTSTC